MAYPLSKFAYSFTQRFQELAAPVERHHLQLADVDEIFSVVESLPLLEYIRFDLSLLDSEFFADLSNVFSCNDKQIRINCDSNIITKFNFKNIPCYSSNSIFKYFNMYREAESVEVIFSARNGTFTKSQMLLSIVPLTYCLVGPTVSYDENFRRITISNEAQWHFWGLRWHSKGIKRHIYVALVKAIVYGLWN
uniref:FBD domain-containing protein n=1 Tax=Panagrellus redivivus TaxID=6233 RepID=A0A7E4UMF4_PANRE